MKTKIFTITIMFLILLSYNVKGQSEYAVIDCKDKFTACYTNCPYCGHRVCLGAPNEINNKIYKGLNKTFCGKCGEYFFYEEGDFRAYIKNLQQRGVKIGQSWSEVGTDVIDKYIEINKQQQQQQQQQRQQILDYYKQQNQNNPNR